MCAATLKQSRCVVVLPEIIVKVHEPDHEFSTTFHCPELQPSTFNFNIV